MLSFYRRYYNTNRLHGGIGWITPGQRYTGEKPMLGGINTIYGIENLNLLPVWASEFILKTG